MQDQTWTFAPGDLERLTDAVMSFSDPSSLGFNAFVEPEPVTSKGRFGRTKEQSSGYMISLMYSPEPAGLMLQITSPDGDIAAQLREGTPALPTGWTNYPSGGDDVIFFPGTPDPPTTARWIVDALRSLGADLPTGKFRGNEPGVLGRSYHSN